MRCFKSVFETRNLSVCEFVRYTINKSFGIMLTVQETCPFGDLSLTLHENSLYPPPDFAGKQVEIEYNVIICSTRKLQAPPRRC